MFAFSGLWRNGGFLKLWAGQTVSLFGSEITLLALPLTAVLTLGAAPSQLGLIAAAERVAFILFSLFAGVWVDRLRRRPIMIAADLGRAAVFRDVDGDAGRRIRTGCPSVLSEFRVRLAESGIEHHLLDAFLDRCKESGLQAARPAAHWLHPRRGGSAHLKERRADRLTSFPGVYLLV